MTIGVVRALLVAALSVSTIAATTGRWMHDVIIDEDRWTETVGDLLDDDQIADEVAEIVTDRVVATAVDQLVEIPFVPQRIEERAEGTLLDRAAPAVRRLVRSEAASDVWRSAVRRSHGSVVAVIRDDDTAFVGDRQIRVDLSPLADRVVETVTGAVAGALEFGGIDIELAPDLDLDLTIVLYDLRDEALGLDVAANAEAHRTAWTLVAVASVAALALVRGRRRLWIGVAGATVVAAVGVFVFAVRRIEPDGLSETWDRVASTTDGYAGTTALFGIGLLVIGAGLLLTER